MHGSMLFLLLRNETLLVSHDTIERQHSCRRAWHLCCICVTGIPSDFPVVFTFFFADLHLRTFDLGSKAMADRLREIKALRCDTSLLVLAHGEQTFGLAFSHRNGFIITHDDDRTTKVWIGYQGSHSFTLFDGNNAHMTKIVSVQVVDDLQQILTADCSGLVKVWDARRNQCLGDFYVKPPDEHADHRKVDLSVAPLQRMIYIHEAHRIVTVGYRSIAVADFVKGESLMSAHDDTIRSLITCCSAGFCVTATGSDVKTWSLVGGGMMNAHRLDRSLGDLTVACVDANCGKLVYGTTHGFVVEIRVSTGKLLKVFDAVLVEPVKPGQQKPHRALSDAASITFVGYVESCTIMAIAAGGVVSFFSDVGSSRDAIRFFDTNTVNQPIAAAPGAKAMFSPKASKPKARVVDLAATVVSLCTTHSNVEEKELTDTVIGRETVAACAFSPCIRKFALGCVSGNIRVLDVKTSSGMTLHEYHTQRDNLHVFSRCLPFLCGLRQQRGNVLLRRLAAGALNVPLRDAIRNCRSLCRIDHGGIPT